MGSMTNRNILYRIYSDTGELLYAGATINPGARIRDHEAHQPWWDEASEIRLERFDTHEQLLAAETTVLEMDSPRYNVTNCRPLWRSKARRRPGGGTFFRRRDGLWIGRVELPSDTAKRRYKTVSSRNRLEAERKFELLKAEVGCS